MCELKDFVDYLKVNVPDRQDTLLIARYVEINLCKLVQFDPLYVTSNEKGKKKLLKSISFNYECLNQIFKHRLITCKSLSFIYQYILNQFDIRCLSISFYGNHVLNSVYNGKISYLIDTQLDLENINSNCQPRFFGFSQNVVLYNSLLPEQIEEFDKKIGIISSVNDYTNIRIKKYLHSLETRNITETIEKILDFIYSINCTVYLGDFGINRFFKNIFKISIETSCFSKINFAFCSLRFQGTIKYISILSIFNTNYVYILDNTHYTKASINELNILFSNNLILHNGSLIINNKLYSSKNYYKLKNLLKNLQKSDV